MPDRIDRAKLPIPFILSCGLSGWWTVHWAKKVAEEAENSTGGAIFFVRYSNLFIPNK